MLLRRFEMPREVSHPAIDIVDSYHSDGHNNLQLEFYHV